MSDEAKDVARCVIGQLSATPMEALLTFTGVDWPESYVPVDEPFVAALCPSRSQGAEPDNDWDLVDGAFSCGLGPASSCTRYRRKRRC